MENFKVFIGEDLAFAGEAIFSAEETGRSLDDFEIVAELSTTALGQKVLCSTLPGKGITISRSGENRFSVNISHTATSSLSPGEALLSMALIHKESGVRAIAESKSISFVESKIASKL